MNTTSNPTPGTGVEFRDLGQALIDLGDNLRALGQISAKREPWDPRNDEMFQDLDYVDQLIVEDQKAGERQDAMTKTLNGLRKFRAEYEHLERLIANYAMLDMGFSQRRTGTLLGFSNTTMHRLAQAARDDEN